MRDFEARTVARSRDEMIACPRCKLPVGSMGCRRCEANKRSAVSQGRRRQNELDRRKRPRGGAGYLYRKSLREQADGMTIKLPGAARVPMPDVPGDALK